MHNPTNSEPNPDLISLQFHLRGPWQQFAKGRLAACRLAAAGSRFLETEQGIDAAVRSYSRGGGWPALSDHEQCLLGARLHWAMCWITALATDGDTAPFVISSGPHWNAETLCEWLLIDAWEQGGGAFLGKFAGG